MRYEATAAESDALDVAINNDAMDKDLFALVATAGGWIVAIVTLAFGYFERKASRGEDLLGKTLAYSDGGSQRRSIGISLLEGI